MSLPTLIITPAHSSATSNKADNSLVLKPMRMNGEKQISQFQLVEFQDNFTTGYSTTDVFGRMDPIVNYKGTTRKIILGLRTTDTTATNMIKNKMKKLQYPVYEGAPSGITNALAIQRPPLIYITFGDVIYGSAGTNTPLLCAMTGFSNSPRVGLTALDSPLVVFGANGTSISFTETTFRFDLIPLHEKTPGFVGDLPKWVGGVL